MGCFLSIIATMVGCLIAYAQFQSGHPGMGVVVLMVTGGISTWLFNLGKGTSSSSSGTETCPFCKGSGWWNQPMATPVGPQQVRQRCPHCSGTGRKRPGT
jgi:hypothetical protein